MFIGKETELKFLNDKHTDACATSLLCCAAGGVSAKPMVIDEFLYMCRGNKSPGARYRQTPPITAPQGETSSMLAA